jgi:hypothetical protein
MKLMSLYLSGFLCISRSSATLRSQTRLDSEVLLNNSDFISFF